MCHYHRLSTTLEAKAINTDIIFFLSNSLCYSFFQCNIADFSGNQWLTSFQESAEAILGTTAENLGKAQQEV